MLTRVRWTLPRQVATSAAPLATPKGHRNGSEFTSARYGAPGSAFHRKRTLAGFSWGLFRVLKLRLGPEGLSSVIGLWKPTKTSRYLSRPTRNAMTRFREKHGTP